MWTVMSRVEVGMPDAGCHGVVLMRWECGLDEGGCPRVGGGRVSDVPDGSAWMAGDGRGQGWSWCFAGIDTCVTSPLISRPGGWEGRGFCLGQFGVVQWGSGDGEPLSFE